MITPQTHWLSGIYSRRIIAWELSNPGETLGQPHHDRSCNCNRRTGAVSLPASRESVQQTRRALPTGLINF